MPKIHKVVTNKPEKKCV